MKKVLIISGIIVFLAVAGVIGKITYDKIYTAEVNKQIEEAGLNPEDYDLEAGASPEEIREAVTKQEIKRTLLAMDISPDDVDLSGLDFTGLSYEEIFDLISERVVEGVADFSVSPAADITPGESPVAMVSSTCDTSKKAKRKFSLGAYYTGPLFDTHIHMPVASKIVSDTAKSLGFEDMPPFGGGLTMDHIACLLKSEDTTHALGFFLATKFSLAQEIQSARSFDATYPDLVVPLMMAAPFDQLRVSTDTVKNTLNSNTGLFMGLGELKVFDGTSMNNPYFTEMYAIANDQGLFVMMHPFADQKGVVESIVGKYPQVKFLIHGGENGAWITDVIAKYPNVYYSLDANMNKLYGWAPEHDISAPSKTEYLSFMDGNFPSEVAKEVVEWKSKIEQYPDRFVWGTDRWYSWHFDTEVSNLAVEFGRSFIAGLDPAVQEKFAYKNAEKIFGK